MPWKKRGNRSYYYRSVRRDGRIHSEYVGGGPVGALVAQSDENRRMLWARSRAMRQRWSVVKSTIAGYTAASNKLLRTTYEAFGWYYSHDRWSKRITTNSKPKCDGSREDFEALAVAANSGKAGAVDELREVLRQNPEVWEAIGDLGQHAEDALIHAVSGGNVLVRESLANTCDSMMLELAGPNPNLVKKLAAHRIVMAWLETEFADLSHPVPAGDLAHARFQLQRKQSAQARFEKAMRTWKLVTADEQSHSLTRGLRVVG